MHCTVHESHSHIANTTYMENLAFAYLPPSLKRSLN